MQSPDTSERRDFEYPKEAIVSYAQTHEDVLLWRALHSVTPGFYVDVGAHDPTALSVTRAFYDHGWRGINIEPHPLYAKRLREERPRDLTMEVAVGDSPGLISIYDFGATGLTTIVKEIAEEHSSAGFSSSEFRVPRTTLATVLCDLGDQEVHFCKVDVEGYERQVLAGADFKKFRPWIVLIEAVKPMTATPSYGSWEPLLLNAGYHFAYFDGLNRFYVSEEHIDLKRFFSVPVSVQDPFHDFEVTRLTAEVARLSAPKYELPGFGVATPTCDTQDAAGLLRIVEAQASELNRLRRSLLSLRSTADQTCNALREAHTATRSREAAILEWIGSIGLLDLARSQRAVSDVIEPPRWQRLGQRLGVVKQVRRATKLWQAELVGSTENAVPDVDSVKQGLQVPRILAELKQLNERLKSHLDTIRGSRWRSLAHALGLEERQAWEVSLCDSPLLLKPFPDIELLSVEETQAATTDVRSGTKVKARHSRSSYEGIVELTNERFLDECREYATDVVLDIGANTGQFAKGLRTQGYLGHIVSFEPLSQAHAALVEAADSDPLWDIAERCAIGANDGWAEINIAGNSFSSSLLPMLDLHREAAPQSEYVGKEACRVTTLDSYIDRIFSDPTTTFGAKVDTQGFEAEVLAGLKRNHHRVKVIVCEMSVAPLYAHGPSMSELCHLLAKLNYRCVALTPEFEDPKTAELLQVNGIFVKRN